MNERDCGGVVGHRGSRSLLQAPSEPTQTLTESRVRVISLASSVVRTMCDAMSSVTQSRLSGSVPAERSIPKRVTLIGGLRP